MRRPVIWILALAIAYAIVTYPGFRDQGWHLGCNTSESQYVTTWAGVQFCRTPTPEEAAETAAAKENVAAEAPSTH